MQKYHQKLRGLRIKAGLTQSEIANSIGINDIHYNAVENGKRALNIKLAEKLASFYGIEVAEVMGFSGAVSPSARMLPVLGTTQAGSWKTIVDDWEGETLPAVNLIGHPNAFYVRVEGESMSPQIQHGDCVVVDPDVIVENNQIGIFVVGDETTIKRLQKDAGQCYLVPDNDRFDTIKATEGTHTIGKVISVLRSQEVR